MHKDAIVIMNARLENNLMIQDLINTPLEHFANAVIDTVPDNVNPPLREKRRQLQRKRTGGLDAPVVTALVSYQ